MYKIISSAFFVITLLGAIYPASAKDLSNRLGIGYSAIPLIKPHGLAVSYYPSETMKISTLLSVDTNEDNSQFGFMAKFSKILFSEPNLNFYAGSGLAIVNYTNPVSQFLEKQQPGGGGPPPNDTSTNPSNSQTGVVFQGHLGAEFFLPGLPSLGFIFEAGINITSLSGNVRLQTMGQSPIKAGIIFYL